MSSLRRYCFCLCLLIGIDNLAYAEPVGKVTNIQGTAFIIDAKKIKRDVFKGDLLHTEDTIQTNNNSLVHLETTNQLSLTLYQNSLLLLDHYKFVPTSPELSTTNFELKQGTLNISNLSANVANSYVIKTPIVNIEAIRANYTLMTETNLTRIDVHQGMSRLLTANYTVNANQGEKFEVMGNLQPRVITTPITVLPLNSNTIIAVKKHKDGRPRLENYSHYKDFLQALYLYKKAQEETIRPTIIIPNLPTNESLPEYSLVDDGYEVTNWAEDLTNLDSNYHPDETILVKQSAKMTMMNRDEMAKSAVKDILGITFFSLADFLDMKDEELQRLISFRADDPKPQQTADITAKLTKQGLKIPHNTVGNDITIISTELGQPEITTISRP